MKIFQHEPLDFPELEVTEIDGKRFYVTPAGKHYPSVTTILGSKPKPELDAWKNRIGHNEAQKYTTQSANRGTAVHKIYEDYVNNRLDVKAYDPFTYSLFKQSVSYLEQGLSKVHNQEFCLYSDILKTAGRCDLLGEWYGVPSIIDYKTSKNNKKEEWILDYFIQLTIYAMMVYERIGKVIPQIVVFIVVENEPCLQIFVRQTKEFISLALKTFREYHEGK